MDAGWIKTEVRSFPECPAQGTVAISAQRKLVLDSTSKQNSQQGCWSLYSRLACCPKNTSFVRVLHSEKHKVLSRYVVKVKAEMQVLWHAISNFG